MALVGGPAAPSCCVCGKAAQQPLVVRFGACPKYKCPQYKCPTRGTGNTNPRPEPTYDCALPPEKRNRNSQAAGWWVRLVGCCTLLNGCRLPSVVLSMATVQLSLPTNTRSKADRRPTPGGCSRCPPGAAQDARCGDDMLLRKFLIMGVRRAAEG